MDRVQWPRPPPQLKAANSKGRGGLAPGRRKEEALFVLRRRGDETLETTAKKGRQSQRDEKRADSLLAPQQKCAVIATAPARPAPTRRNHEEYEDASRCPSRVLPSQFLPCHKFFGFYANQESDWEDRLNLSVSLVSLFVLGQPHNRSRNRIIVSFTESDS